MANDTDYDLVEIPLDGTPVRRCSRRALPNTQSTSRRATNEFAQVAAGEAPEIRVREPAPAAATLVAPDRRRLIRTRTLNHSVAVDGDIASRVASQPRTCLLKKSRVRCQASFAAASSYRGVVSLLNPCCVPG